MLQLILGGARSGKSRLAERIAEQTACPVCYVATARAEDQEMQQRIAMHQAQRPSTWQVFEEPLYLAKQLQAIDQAGQVIVVDCLTLWMSNLLIHANPELQQQQCDALFEVVVGLKSHVILVSNETGLGVVPMGELSRKFVDESGRLHQRLGQLADNVVFCVAGFPMQLKGESVCSGI